MSGTRRPYRATSFRGWYYGYWLCRRAGPSAEWDDGSKEWHTKRKRVGQYPDGTNVVVVNGTKCFSVGPLDMSGIPGYKENP